MPIMGNELSTCKYDEKLEALEVSLLCVTSVRTDEDHSIH